MNSSSFLCGAFIGAFAGMVYSRRRGMGMSKGQSGGLGGAADKARDKMMEMAAVGFGDKDGKHNNASVKHEPNAHETVRSKESSMKMIKEFIRSNPNVKHEVEEILKETHTAVPGL